MDTNTKNWIITGAVAVVLVGLVWWGVAQKRTASPVVNGTATTTEEVSEKDQGSGTQSQSESKADTVSEAMTAVAAGETVTTFDQAAGDSVLVSQATLKSPSWIAIKDTKGWILGAGWFASSGENLQVSLLRATEPGEVYQAVIYVDDGDKQFDFHTDTLLTSVDGAPVSSTFRAQEAQ